MAISTLRKAAVLLLSLPYEQRSQLLGRLEPQQSAAVVAAMNGLGQVDSAEQEAVVREFAAANMPTSGGRPAKKTVPFQFLHDLSSEALLDLIADEHPQTIALILSCVPPQQAAAVFAELAMEDQIALLCRIATIDAASPEIVRDVENGLKSRLRGAAGGPAGNRGVASVVKILNTMAPTAERSLLGKLAEVEPQLVGEIRRAMFGVDAAADPQQAVSGVAC